MPQPPDDDPLELRPVKPLKSHLHLLALAAVAPLTLALTGRLTHYSPAHCHKLLEDLRHWGYLRPAGELLVMTPLGRRSLAEMIRGARQELAARRS